MLTLVFLLLAADPENKPFTSPAFASPEYGQGLVAEQASDGWIALFDGQTTFGWKGAKFESGALSAGQTTSTSRLN